MSANAWWRRRRNKYLRPYMNYVDRHPDRALALPGNRLLTSESIMNRAIDYLPRGTYRSALVFEMLARDSITQAPNDRGGLDESATPRTRP